MRIQAQFNVNGKPTSLDTESGLMPMTQRGRLEMLRQRTDKQGRVCQQTVLNGDRLALPALLEVEANTLDALLSAVEKDEIRLRGPIRQVSLDRVIHHRNQQTGEDYYTKAGVRIV